VAAIRAALPRGTPIELWWQDEARVGQKNGITRRWAKRGTRPSAPKDQRTKSAYIFGAICPELGKGAGLILPFCNTQTMSLHLDNLAMYVVERVARGHRYLYLVESVREGKTVRQRTIKALGRKDVLAASGELDRLAASIARHAERSVILSDIDAGRIAARRIGGPLLFGRLWQRLGIDAVLEEVREGRQFGFAVERAVFVATLHRLFVSGSDRACPQRRDRRHAPARRARRHCARGRAYAANVRYRATAGRNRGGGG
jgi:hypothetical protein